MGKLDRIPATVLGGLLLLACGACNQPWKFARPGDPIPAGRPLGAVGCDARLAAASPARPPRTAMPPEAASPVSPTWQQPPIRGVSFGVSSAAAPPTGAEVPETDSVLPPCQGSGFDSAILPRWEGRLVRPEFRARLRSQLREAVCRVRSDHRNYYDCATMRDLWLGVAAGAVLANTSLDDDFQGWHQRDVRNTETDHFADFWMALGEGQIFIPAYVGLTLVGRLFPDRPLLDGMGEYSGRVTRAYLVGTPPMLLMQFLLGGSRPGECSVGSQWKPFDDNNGLSGHAFIGVVPFLTAAKMCDRPLLKATFYTLSTFPAWSRVNDDAHYLSQACLGWWIAYLACSAVNDTQHPDRRYTFTPLLSPEATGIGVIYRH